MGLAASGEADDLDDALAAAAAVAPADRLRLRACPPLGARAADALVWLMASRPGLQSLALERSSLSEAGACALGRALPCFPRLARLELSRTPLDDAAAAALAAGLGACVRHLDLAGSALSGAAAAVLVRAVARGAGGPAAVRLDDNPLIGDAGARRVAAALPRGGRRLALALSDCGVGDAGVAALAHALRPAGGGACVETLLLRETDDLSAAGVDALAGALEAGAPLRALALSAAASELDAGALARLLRAGARLTHLELEPLELPPPGETALARAAAKAPALKWLALGGVVRTEAFGFAIHGCAHLRALSVGGVAADVQGVLNDSLDAVPYLAAKQVGARAWRRVAALPGLGLGPPPRRWARAPPLERLAAAPGAPEP